MNYYIEKFIKENYKEQNEGAYNYILNYCIRYFDKPGKMSELIINGLNTVYMTYYKKGKSLPYKAVYESIEKEINLEHKDEQNINKFSKEHINSIQIKNFKGFGCVSECDKGIYINLHDKKNIIFGPNGSGKTSFCEALEYKLTGSIKEAKKRGIKDKEYFKRSNSEKSEINIKFNTDNLSTADINEYEKSEFNKCFIEKNRINEFALLRGHKDTGVKANDVTARLLGFEIFDDFRSKFVSPKQFQTRVEILFVKKSAQELEELVNLNTSYINQYNSNKEKINIEEYRTLLNIEQEVEAKRFFLEKVSSKIKSNNHKAYIKKDVFSWLWKLKLNIRRLEIIEEQLKEKSKELNLSELYKAVIKIKSKADLNICPVCKTPLDKTVENPFDYADNEIIKLENINKLNSKRKEISSLLTTSYWEEIKEFISNYEYSSQKSKKLELAGIRTIIEKFDSVNDEDERLKRLSYIFTADKYLISSYLHLLDIEVNKDLIVDKLRSLILNKLNELERINKQNIIEKSKYNSIYREQKKIYLKLSEYRVNLKKLEIAKKWDNAFNEFLVNLITNYKVFISDLNDYILKEQKELISKIKDRILKYYNAINKGDSEDEKIQEIYFREQSDKTYTIELKRKDGWKKAGVILSEGHLRVLGLSIILSIAESSKVQFIIFDDVVNAIDSEHRANIIEMFFCNRYLKKTQLIVTTHDRLFWERFCNTYSKRINRREMEKISSCFKYCDNSIHYLPYSVSYEEKIKEALEFYDIRQSLVYLRIWFESICFDYCKRQGKKIEGYFSINQNEKPTHLIVSITTVYDKIIKKEFNESSNLKTITENLNWNFLNQEHHSYDENIFNVNHSTTSNEVQVIFDALKKFQEEVNDSFVINEL